MSATSVNRLNNVLGNGSSKHDTTSNPQAAITIPKIEPKVLQVWVDGITPLLVCAWSEKAMNMILEKQMKKASKGKEAKDPEKCYRDSLYTSTEGWTGVPAGGIKGCLINAVRAIDDLNMTDAKRLVFVRSEGTTASGQGLVRIHGEHQMHRGMVRISGGVADVRFRAIYPKWSMRLEVEFLPHMLSAEQVVNLIELAGFVEGLCEHRPGAPKSHTGDFGRFAIRRAE